MNLDEIATAIKQSSTQHKLTLIAVEPLYLKSSKKSAKSHAHP